MTNIRLFEHLTQSEKDIIERALTEEAPDLLEDIRNGVSLSPGPRLRLGDLLDDYAMDVMTSDYGDTPESKAVGQLVGKLRRLQPVDVTKLQIYGWKRGDPIRRGMARYEEVDRSTSDSDSRQ